MIDSAYIAKKYGISDRMHQLKTSLLSIKGVVDVQFDLNGYLDNIYQVIVIAKYSIEYLSDLGAYYKAHGRIQKELVNKARALNLTRSEDAIEDYGEHFYIVFSSKKWNDNREYALFYESGGREIPVGSEGWVPSRNIVTKLLEYHSSRAVLKDKDIYIRERVKQRLYQPLKQFNGKVVYNRDYCFLNALSAGDLVGQDVYNFFVDAVQPACLRSDCTQLGEAASIKIDENGHEKNVYETIRKIADGIYEYCGRCFRGENRERGSYPTYVL